MTNRKFVGIVSDGENQTQFMTLSSQEVETALHNAPNEIATEHDRLKELFKRRCILELQCGDNGPSVVVQFRPKNMLEKLAAQKAIEDINLHVLNAELELDMSNFSKFIRQE